MLSGPNIFARLHKWATRQDENFLTESLTVVLEQLLILAPEAGTRLLSRLTDGFIEVPPHDATTIELLPQVETGKGRPDLEICTPYRKVWIEVKAESELRTGQLEGYRRLLSVKDNKLTRLILLTRYPEVYSADTERPDIEIRWFEVADWFENELPMIDAAGQVAGFVGRQFLEFMRLRGMTLTHVNKFMPEGLRALDSLLNMLVEAAVACKVPFNKVSGWNYSGITLDGHKYGVSIHFSDPEKLWFGTRCQIDHGAAVRLGVGELSEENWVPGRFRWWQCAELDSEDIHFFSRTKVGQMQWLEAFLRDCLTKARSIETPDQPPIPEEPEGN